MKKVESITYQLNKHDQEQLEVAKQALPAYEHLLSLAADICKDNHKCDSCPLEMICTEGSERIPMDKLIEFFDEFVKE